MNLGVGGATKMNLAVGGATRMNLFVVVAERGKTLCSTCQNIKALDTMVTPIEIVNSFKRIIS